MDVCFACQDESLLEKIVEKTGIEIDPQRIMGRYLCKINNHFLFLNMFPYKIDLNCVDRLTHNELVYHKNLYEFFVRYPNTHLGNTLLVDDAPYRTYLNLPFNAIFIESYEYTPKEDNYLMKTIFPYLEFLHNSRLIVPTFVELYPFSTIRSIKEDDVKFQMSFKKCTMAYFAIFCINRLTSIESSPNILFCSFLPFFFFGFYNLIVLYG
jgi:hypothetical protein